MSATLRTIRVLIVDDHTMVGSALATALGSEDDLTVAGVASDLEQAFRVLDSENIDVVILDLRLSAGVDTASEIPRIHEARPDCKVVILTASGDERSVLRAVRAGCDGYLLKEQPFHELVASIRSVAAGKPSFAPALVEIILASTRYRTDSARPLTERELEVLHLLAAGRTTREVASEMFISVNTVRNLIQGSMSKLHAHNRLEAVSIAVKTGVISTR